MQVSPDSQKITKSIGPSEAAAPLVIPDGNARFVGATVHHTDRDAGNTQYEHSKGEAGEDARTEEELLLPGSLATLLLVEVIAVSGRFLFHRFMVFVVGLVFTNISIIERFV